MRESLGRSDGSEADRDPSAVNALYAATAQEHFAGPDGINELHGNGTMISVAVVPQCSLILLVITGDLSGPATGPLYEPVVQMGFSYKGKLESPYYGSYILTEMCYTGLFVGSLYELWTRNASNTTLSAFVEAYVATQVCVTHFLSQNQIVTLL
jgi:hypothetical protein